MRGAVHLPARCGAEQSLSYAGPVDLAAPGCRRNNRTVHLVDLQPVGSRLGLDSAVHHARGLVLAARRHEPARDGTGAGAARAKGGGVVSQTVIDVSPLPEHAFGQRSLQWWATMGM